MFQERPSRSHRELDVAWLELTWLKRDAEKLHYALAEAGLEIEAMTASVIISGLAVRLADISEELQQIGSDQPCL